MKRQRSDPEPKYALCSQKPARRVKLHVNAQLPAPMEIRPQQGACFTKTTLRHFTALLLHTPDTVHIRIVLDEPSKLTRAFTTGHAIVDAAWQQHSIKRFSLHAATDSHVQLEQSSTSIDQIRVINGLVCLYTEDGLCRAIIDVPTILLQASGNIILDSSLE